MQPLHTASTTPFVWQHITNITQDLPAATKGHLKTSTSTGNAACDRQVMSGSGRAPGPLVDATSMDDDVDEPVSPNGDFHHDPEQDFTYNVQPSDLGPRYFRDVAQGGQKALLVIMVGLPACGKTFLAQKLSRLLSWQGYKAQVYNCQVAWKRKLRSMLELKRTAKEEHKTPPSGTSSGGKLSSPATTHVADAAVMRSPVATDVMAMPALSGIMMTQTDSNDLLSSPTSLIVNSAAAYRDLYESPNSLARQAYVAVLNELATSAATFYQNESYSGNVVILNDDFATAELRELAQRTVGSTATRVIFVEVQHVERSNAQQALFSELKAKDPAEYIPQHPQGHDAAALLHPASPDSLPSPQASFPSGPAGVESSGLGVHSPARLTTVLEPAFALRDFNCRVEHITRVYETMTPDSQKSYVKLTNASVLEIHKVTGFLCSRIVSFLMNLSQNKMQHPIYFVRHGQSMYNLDDRLGGNPELTPKGHADAAALCAFLAHLQEDEKRRGVENEMEIWTSQLRRAIQTAEPAETTLGIPCLRWSSLNEIHAGVCENMTYKEVEITYPLIHRFRCENKYSFRYPEGESYQDLVFRLEPIIMELENASRVVVVVAHQAVLRALLAYFGGTPAESAVYVEVPHRCVWRCSYSTAGKSSLDMVKLGAATAGDGRKD